MKIYTICLMWYLPMYYYVDNNIYIILYSIMDVMYEYITHIHILYYIIIYFILTNNTNYLGNIRSKSVD